jgi:hypothetical protein
MFTAISDVSPGNPRYLRNDAGLIKPDSGETHGITSVSKFADIVHPVERAPASTQ